MDVTMVKCACADSVCVVKTEAAVEKEGRLYCSPESSQGRLGLSPRRLHLPRLIHNG